MTVFGPVFPDLRDNTEELPTCEALRLALVAKSVVAIMIGVTTGVWTVGSPEAVITGSGSAFSAGGDLPETVGDIVAFETWKDVMAAIRNLRMVEAS